MPDYLVAQLSEIRKGYTHHLPIMMFYLCEALRRTGTRYKTMYDIFYLHLATWIWIIAMGIKNNQDNIEALGLEDQYLGTFTQESPTMKRTLNFNLK